MKKLLLLALCLLPFAFAQAQTNVIYADVANYGLTPQTRINVTWTLLSPNPRTYNGILIRQDPFSKATGTNGQARWTNIIWGDYRVDVSGQVGTRYNVRVGTNTIGTVSLASLVQNPGILPPDTATNYYTMLQVDSLLSGVGIGAPRTNWSVVNVTNAGTAAYSNASAFYLSSNPSNFASTNYVNTATNNVTTNLLAVISTASNAVWSAQNTLSNYNRLALTWTTNKFTAQDATNAVFQSGIDGKLNITNATAYSFSASPAGNSTDSIKVNPNFMGISIIGFPQSQNSWSITAAPSENFRIGAGGFFPTALTITAGGEVSAYSNITTSATISGGQFSGNGYNLTNLQASAIVGGFDSLRVTNEIVLGENSNDGYSVIKLTDNSIGFEIVNSSDSWRMRLTPGNGDFSVSGSINAGGGGSITAGIGGFIGDGSQLTGVVVPFASITSGDTILTNAIRTTASAGLTTITNHTLYVGTNIPASAFGSVDATNIVSGTIALARYGFTPATNGAAIVYSQLPYQGLITNANGVNLTNISPANITSNGTFIVNGVLATNSGLTSGAFLSETGTSRKYSNNGASITNVVAAFVSGTLTNSITGNAATATTLATSPTLTNVLVWGSSARSNNFGFDSSGLTMTNLVGITNTMFNSSTGLVFTAKGTNGSADFTLNTNGNFTTSAGNTYIGQMESSSWAGISTLNSKYLELNCNQAAGGGGIRFTIGNFINIGGFDGGNSSGTLPEFLFPNDGIGTFGIASRRIAGVYTVSLYSSNCFANISTATNGFAVTATNTYALAATGWTNVIGANARVLLAASTTAILYNTNGVALATIGPSGFVEFTMHPLERLVGTVISGTATP